MGEIQIRKEYTRDQFSKLYTHMEQARELVAGKACVYATGSYGRGEAGPKSDLDLFIVSNAKPSEDKNKPADSQLSNLNAICLKAELIKATKTLGIKEFDGDGRYLEHHTRAMLIKYLGHPKDDAINTFTARVLLLLESTPLLEKDVYDETIGDVIAEYWKDYTKHIDNFSPAYLVNDILRLWRTFCVNYEARTERQPEEKRIKRKLKNYTLKYSRILTCYSALLYLLHTFSLKRTVCIEDAKNMVSMTPIERLIWLSSEPSLTKSQPILARLMDMYDDFLESKRNDEKLTEEFSDRAKAHQYMDAANKFGAEMFHAINEIGNNSRLHQIIVV